MTLDRCHEAVKLPLHCKKVKRKSKFLIISVSKTNLILGKIINFTGLQQFLLYGIEIAQYPVS